jgi:hypothetical protein
LFKGKGDKKKIEIEMRNRKQKKKKEKHFLSHLGWAVSGPSHARACFSPSPPAAQAAQQRPRPRRA